MLLNGCCKEWVFFELKINDNFAFMQGNSVNILNPILLLSHNPYYKMLIMFIKKFGREIHVKSGYISWYLFEVITLNVTSFVANVL